MDGAVSPATEAAAVPAESGSDGPLGQDRATTPGSTPSPPTSPGRPGPSPAHGGPDGAEKRVTMDTSKLNVYLFELESRASLAEEGLTSLLQERLDRAKAGRVSLTQQLNRFTIDEEENDDGEEQQAEGARDDDSLGALHGAGRLGADAEQPQAQRARFSLSQPVRDARSPASLSSLFFAPVNREKGKEDAESRPRQESSSTGSMNGRREGQPGEQAYQEDSGDSLSFSPRQASADGLGPSADAGRLAPLSPRDVPLSPSPLRETSVPSPSSQRKRASSPPSQLDAHQQHYHLQYPQSQLRMSLRNTSDFSPSQNQGDQDAPGFSASRMDFAAMQSAMQHSLDELHGMIVDASKRIKDMEMDVKQRGKLQSAKDTAQDEILEMEVKQLSRQLETKLGRSELMDINALQNQKLKSIETAMLGIMDEKTQRLHHKLHEEMDKVLQQLYNIQQVAEKNRRVVEDRIKQSLTDHVAIQRELQKERHDKEDLQAQVKRLADHLVQFEARQAEEALQQRELIQAMEERWSQQMARESANVRKDLKAMATAVQDDINASAAGLRAEREELRVELRGAIQEVEATLGSSKAALEQQVADSRAAHDQSLHALETSLRAAMDKRAQALREDLSARAREISELQQRADKATALLAEQSARMDLLHAEAMAALDTVKAGLTDQLQAKVAAVQAALQENHMQLSERLSVTVQRLALSEVKGVERHDLLKALVKEVALKLLDEEALSALGENPSMADLVEQLGIHRSATAAELARVEHLVVGLAESSKQMRCTMQALASRDNHGAVLEATLQEHCEGLVEQCTMVQVEHPPLPTGRRVMLRKEAKDYIATNSYRIAKAVASKADYEVIRLVVGRKEPMADEECDATILRLREAYLKQFMQNLNAGVDKKQPTHEPRVAEARLHFYDKVEQAVRLAMSKFSRIHVGRTLFGKISLEVQPTCASCNRPFPEDPHGDRRPVACQHMPPQGGGGWASTSAAGRAAARAPDATPVLSTLQLQLGAGTNAGATANSSAARRPRRFLHDGIGARLADRQEDLERLLRDYGRCSSTSSSGGGRGGVP